VNLFDGINGSIMVDKAKSVPISIRCSNNCCLRLRYTCFQKTSLNSYN